MSLSRFVVVSGVVALLAAGPSMAAAASPRGGGSEAGCAPGGGWSLWDVSDVLDMLGLTEAPPSMDGNGDGFTCIRFQTLANGRKGWTAGANRHCSRA